MENFVSIIMPAHNSEKTISKSVESVLCQSYKNWELLIALDNCSDSTKQIVIGFANRDSRIAYFETSDNLLGAIGARNLLIEKANGRFISFLDADDVWYPQKLEMQVKFMIEKDITFCYSNYDVFKNNAKIKSFIAPSEATYSSLIKNCYIGCLTAIYDTAKIGKVFMPINALKREDFATWLLILKTIPKAYNINLVLARYNINSNSVSSNKLKIIKYQWNLFRKVEKISVTKSFFLLCSNIFNKLFKY